MKKIEELKRIVNDNDRRHWIPDSEVSKCEKCYEVFSFIRRRHHCRLCGHVFCKKCCVNVDMDGLFI